MAKKTVNSDIYNITDLVDGVRQIYLPDEDEDTLAIGLYGYISDLESHRLQTQVQMTGELANESFPSRARLERNVITHAILANITDINAVPAKMTVFMVLKESDIKDYIEEDLEHIFRIDRECPIFLGDFEFHLEYDILLQRIITSNNKISYAAQYDMDLDHIYRLNPSSTVTNAYLAPPAVVTASGERYIYITTIISQVTHNSEYRKLVTSNIVDNKTINFEFTDGELAYFEVHCKESDADYFLTPVFEGSNVPNGTRYYCWYQYIDVNLIRVRFDRNSYMPGLNAEVEVLYKTTQGRNGNFTYTEDAYADLSSDNYGYKNISALITPLTDSANGKNRKTKRELQGIIPKEILARGSITTITDLNNYFEMLDDENGRVIIQKKIDNQIERVYYGYLVVKDINNNIVPSNTINIHIPIEYLQRMILFNSQSPRFVLKSGTCIKLGSDGIGYINTDPLPANGYRFTGRALTRGKKTTATFRAAANLDDTTFDAVSAYVSIGDCNTAVMCYPADGHSMIVEDNAIEPLEEDYTQLSIGKLYSIEVECVATYDDSVITVRPINTTNFTFYSAYYYTTDPENKTNIDSTLTFDNRHADTEYHIVYIARLNGNANSLTNHQVTMTVEVDEATTTIGSSTITSYVPTITSSSNSDNTEFTYTIEYLSTTKTYTPIVTLKLSEGLEYIPASMSVTYDTDTYPMEPAEVPITEDYGFVYTNPLAISINQYHLYSAFYLMAVDENPFLQFINNNDNKMYAQFIGTNVSWKRPFLGINKDTYTLSFTLTQSVQEDLGLFPDPEDVSTLKIKALVVFYRDGEWYRYRTMDFDETTTDLSTFTYGFTQTFSAKDVLDNDNNIRVEGAQVCGQSDQGTFTEYGFFNPSTQTRIYTFVSLPDVDGTYSVDGLDAVSPDLNGWTLTNTYEIVNGLTFYNNYAEIMGSAVKPFGTVDSGTEVLTLEGFDVMNVPVIGYKYAMDEVLSDKMIAALNYRKAYIDNSLAVFENSFGIDFKLFNTYGPSRTYYIIRDSNKNNILDENKEYIDRINLTLHFRVKLLSSNDNYTEDNIRRDIKAYVEDLAEITDLHIPNLITEITNKYSEQINYIEYLGFNEQYGPDIQHIYKDTSDEIDIHTAPEFLNINNSLNVAGELIPDVMIHLSDI